MAITGPAAAYLLANPGIAAYPQMTIAAWIKAPGSGTGTNYCFRVQTTGPSHAAVQFNIHYAGTPPNSFGSVGQGLSGSYDCTAIGGFANQVWHFILATFDNGGVQAQLVAVNLYIDGVFNNTVGGGPPRTGFTANADPTSWDFIQPGDVDGGAIVDYCMIWKRMISTAEISALAANGDPRVVAPAQLVSFASLNQAGTIPDLVGTMSWVPNGSLTVVAPPFVLAPYPPVVPPAMGGYGINPPFLPVSFPVGPPTVPAWEDGASLFANSGPIRYNGQNQTSQINQTFRP
jgi:hypothetical protein